MRHERRSGHSKLHGRPLDDNGRIELHVERSSPQPLGKSVVDWRNAALILGESLAANGPTGYYTFTPQQWLAWAQEQIGTKNAQGHEIKVGEQMTDIYGDPCDVHQVRKFRNGREMGAGYSLRRPSEWFIYDRESSDAKWHMHCGPCSSFHDAKDWIDQIREEHRGKERQ